MTLKEHKLNGLVLAGGMSTRMGKDKSTLHWHDKEQRYHMADMLAKFCDNVFISCRAEQASTINLPYKIITDTVAGKGPIVGILSALTTDTQTGWLVVACDLPLIDETTLQQLINSRDTSKVATTYKSPHDNLPEPLITIWEPKSAAALNEFKAKGYNCPRKVLINSDTHIIEPDNPQALINANTPEDAAQVQSILAQAPKTL